MTLPAVAGLFLLAALVPGHEGFTTRPLNTVLRIVTAPPRQAINWAASQFSRTPTTASSAELKAMQDEMNRWKSLYFQEKVRREQSDARLDQIQRGLALNREFNVRQLPASVIGPTSDASSSLFDVRAGTADGVEVGSVVAFDGVNLVGRVTRADTKSCQVQPVFDAKAPPINGIVFPLETSSDLPPDPGGVSLVCKLTPTRSGTLAGPAEGRSLRNAEPAPPLKAGMLVRLADETWPRSAQMLVIGRIEEVQVLANGRERIVVRSAFKPPLAEVMLRLPDESGKGGKP
ncbi:MAG: rod shape-determining protein MreC [Phycisphaerales bacterium]